MELEMLQDMDSFLIIVAFFRELLGSGKLLGYQVIPDAFMQWDMKIMD